MRSDPKSSKSSAWQDGDADSRTQEGGGVYAKDSSFEMSNCTVLRNSGIWGSGVYSFGGDPTIHRCVFTENFSYIWSGFAARIMFGEPEVSYCTFVDNYGGGLEMEGSKPIIGCKFIGNSRGNGLTLGYGAPNVIDCTFSRNRRGMYSSSNTYPQLFNCGFFANAAPTIGGGIWSDGGLILLNCVFVGNTAGGWVYPPGAPPNAGWAGALNVDYGAFALVLNCVFIGNSAGGAAGMWSGGSATIAHSIFWGNTDDEGTGEDAQIRYYSDNPPTVRYSDIQGWTGVLGGEGNVDVNPWFVDPDGPDDVLGTEDDNLRLAMESLLINAGDPDPPLLQRYDGDGHFRTLYGRVDIGAYEFGVGDYDWDLVCDLGDFAVWESCMTGPDSDTYDDDCRAFDFDADGDVDLFDLAGFQRESGTVHTIKRPSTIFPYRRK